MGAQTTPQRPEILDTLTEAQMKELEFQAEEYDREQFLRLGISYGWDPDTTERVWAWFEVLPEYPIDGAGE